MEIMWAFICQGYRHSKLECLNWCQMYLHTVYLLEICTATGDGLKCHHWQKPSQITSQYIWPTIPKPTTGEWQTWQWAVQQTYSLGHNLALPIPLGRWHQTRLVHIDWFYSQDDKALYCHDSKEWTRHRQTPSQT